MTKEEFIGKLRSIYVGEENAIDEIISEYDIQKRTIQYLSECINEKDGLIIEYTEEIDRLKENINTAIEDIFTLIRVLDANVKELKCTDEELKVINKYSYNPKEVKND